MLKIKSRPYNSKSYSFLLHGMTEERKRKLNNRHDGFRLVASALNRGK